MALDYVCPLTHWMIRRGEGGWYFQRGEVFWRAESGPMATANADERERVFGLTKRDVVYGCFRINGGRHGWYIADLKRQKYYYCGETQEDAIALLSDLTQIGIAHPQGL